MSDDIKTEVWQGFDPEALRAALLECFAELGLSHAVLVNRVGDEDLTGAALANRLAPLLAAKLSRRVS